MPNPNRGIAGAISTLASWAAIALLVWGMQARLLPIFEDFDVELPGLARLLAAPLVPVGVILIGVLFAVLQLVTAHTRAAPFVLGASLAAWSLAVGLTVVAFFLPLVNLIQNLAG
ncbi:MAG: hypothetical protein KDA37_11605 [Planctomycetales bacterium]|nr:hypothetical protein [Planctomycetales bacterium]